MKHFILATAGHVDHGKTALIKALTGTDTDRLPEEKKRGITIELGFAQLELPGASIGIVDVPGHEDFVKNMVGGVGSIDLALLVVAADDGWMPQTEEHLQILNYLGISRAVVALTKCDLENETDAKEREVRAKLTNTPLAAAPIIRTSTVSGAGIEELKRQLAAEFAGIAPPRDVGKPRLPIDRAFSLRGIGTVVTGTLNGGVLHKGDAIIVQPSGDVSRVRALQNHHREVEAIGPGTRTALNLDLPIAGGRGEDGLARGDVITRDSLGKPHDVADVLLARSPRLPPATRPVRNGAMVRVHHGSGHRMARVFFLKGQYLRPGESAIAELRFDAPVFYFAGDRCVVRDPSEQQTLAGGVVLDPDGNAKTFRGAAQKRLLQTRAASPEALDIFVATQIERAGAAREGDLLAKSRWSAEEIAAAVRILIASGEAAARGGWIVAAKFWSALSRAAMTAIDAEHAAHPDRSGLELPRLRACLPRDLPATLIDEMVSDLCRDGFVRKGETIQRAGHRPVAPPALQPAVARVRAALSAKPFDPPSRKELASDAAARQALRFLRESGEVMEIGTELVLSADALEKMRGSVIAAIRQAGGATVSDLRRSLGSSRRVVVPLLEYFDKLGVTRRVGDKRVLGSAL